MDVTVRTTAEVDAAEGVLAEAHGMHEDGYFRTLGLAVLEAARDAALREFAEQPLGVAELVHDEGRAEHAKWARALGEGLSR